MLPRVKPGTKLRAELAELTVPTTAVTEGDMADTTERWGCHRWVSLYNYIII